MSGQVDLIDTLGLSNAFYNMAGTGYYLGLGGLAIVLLGIYGRRPGGRTLLLRDIWFAPLCIAGVFAVLFVPRAIGEYHSQMADAAATVGDDALAMAELRQMPFWMPTVAYSLNYQARIGDITGRRGCVSCPETYLAQAAAAVKSRDFGAAVAALERAATLDPTMPGLNMWLGQGYLELGLDTFNAGFYSSADTLFRQAIAHYPAQALAWYGRGIVQIRRHDYGAAAGDLLQVVRLQQYLGFRKYPPHAQWLLAGAWQAYQSGDYNDAHRLFSEYLTPELWVAVE